MSEKPVLIKDLMNLAPWFFSIVTAGLALMFKAGRTSQRIVDRLDTLNKTVSKLEKDFERHCEQHDKGA